MRTGFLKRNINFEGRNTMNNSTNNRASRRQHNITRNRYRNLQVKATRSLLHVVTLVAIVALLVSFTICVFTMIGTCAKLWNISDGVTYYESERATALELRLGDYATRCDEHIVELYAERNALINSDNSIVSYTAQHKWPAIGTILLYFALVAGIVQLIRKRLDETFNVYMKVIDIEEFLVRCAVALVSLILMWIFAIVSVFSDSFAKAFNVIWNQSRPRRKPESKFEHRKPVQSDKVVSIEKSRRRRA